MLKQPGFARAVARNLRKRWPKAVVRLLNREGAWGAVELAREAGADLHRHPVAQVDRSTSGALPTATTDPKGPHSSTRYTVGDLDALFGVGSVLTQSPTEQRNPRSTRLDKLSLAEAIRLLLEEEAKVPGILLAESKKIESAVRWIVRSFHDGGRLFYVGAGTSGRLGVLDASECPPTFRCPPEQVQGIIAGGSQALWNSIEGAEDDGAAGADAVKFRGVRLNDVVVGIAASGRTPFVWGAMIEAKKRGAKTILICFNPYLRAPPSIQPNLIIAPNLGPEVLTGSTRLKSGTATKLILNIFTTLAMVRMGKVHSNLMVDLNPSNAKLRDRAVRIVQELNRVDYSKARAALERCRWVIKSAHRWLDAHPGAPATQKVRVPRREATARR